VASTQEAYIQSLREIKDAEENAEKEVQTHKGAVEAEISNLRVQLEKEIIASKEKGERMVDKALKEDRERASEEAQAIIKEAESKSRDISLGINNEMLRKIREILLKGLE
jgi:vacuolar-type H+-ATPase subunit H